VPAAPLAVKMLPVTVTAEAPPKTKLPEVAVFVNRMAATLVTAASFCDEVLVVPEKFNVAPVAPGGDDQLPAVLHRLSAPNPVQF
jgi:hypothetical protein